MAQFLAGVPAAAGSAVSGLGSAAAGLGKAALSVPGAVGKEALSLGQTFGKALGQPGSQLADAPMSAGPMSGGNNPVSASPFGGAPSIPMGGGYRPSPPVYQPDSASGLPTATGNPIHMPAASAPIAGPAPIQSSGAPPASFADMFKAVALNRLASGAGSGGQDASAAMQAGMMGKPYAPSLTGQQMTPDQIKQILQMFGAK